MKKFRRFNFISFNTDESASGGSSDTGAPPNSNGVSASGAASGAGNDDTYGGLVTPPDTRAAGSSDGAGGESDATPPASDNNAANQDSQAYRPDGLPDDMVGATDQETIDKLLAGQTKSQAPEKAEDYKFEFEDDIQAAFQKDDPVLKGWSEVAHKHGLSNEQATNLMQDVMKGWIADGLVDKPVAPEAFFNALADDGSTDKMADGQKRVNEAAAFVQGLENRNILTAEQKIVLTKFGLSRPENVGILEAIKAATSGHGIQTGGKEAGLGTTKDELSRMMKDPRYNINNREFDQGYYDQVQKLGQELYN